VEGGGGGEGEGGGEEEKAEGAAWGRASPF